MQDIEYIVKRSQDLLTNQAVREIVAGGWLIDDTHQFTVLYRIKPPLPTPGPPTAPTLDADAAPALDQPPADTAPTEPPTEPVGATADPPADPASGVPPDANPGG